jgi:hypothetical protein
MQVPAVHGGDGEASPSVLWPPISPGVSFSISKRRVKPRIGAVMVTVISERLIDVVVQSFDSSSRPPAVVGVTIEATTIATTNTMTLDHFISARLY